MHNGWPTIPAVAVTKLCLRGSEDCCNCWRKSMFKRPFATVTTLQQQIYRFAL